MTTIELSPDHKYLADTYEWDYIPEYNIYSLYSGQLLIIINPSLHYFSKIIFRRHGMFGTPKTFLSRLMPGELLFFKEIAEQFPQELFDVSYNQEKTTLLSKPKTIEGLYLLAKMNIPSCKKSVDKVLLIINLLKNIVVKDLIKYVISIVLELRISSMKTLSVISSQNVREIIKKNINNSPRVWPVKF